MRIRTLLPTLLLAVGGLLVLASPASAQEGQGEPQLSEDTEECIELAEEADDPDACQEAPNPILPATDELVWGSISFAVLLFLLYKFAYPQISQMLENRTERIRSDLQAAETAKGDAEQILAEYRAQLNDARAEAGRIIEEARQAADRLKRDQETRLQTELGEVRARAVADIESAKAQAVSDLRGELAQLAIGAAETVVQHNLDEATQTQLIEDYINQVAAQRS
ncbi:MAG TPA: F0F1 ATP synthase subunit B [Acidimicrobiales bacterium]|nr:F0F1 ATP synthase subunit B [Acidimicrobiales bacterium]